MGVVLFWGVLFSPWLAMVVLGSLYFGAHRASAFATAGRLRCANPRQVAALDAAFASDVPAQLGFGF